MNFVVHLEFQVDGISEVEAWEIADSLEKAARKREYRGISSYVVPTEGRSALLGTEANPVESVAVREERVSGLQATAIGGQGDSGRDVVQLRHYGDNP